MGSTKGATLGFKNMGIDCQDRIYDLNPIDWYSRCRVVWQKVRLSISVSRADPVRVLSAGLIQLESCQPG